MKRWFSRSGKHAGKRPVGLRGRRWPGRLSPLSTRRLRFEPLESRQLLAVVVIKGPLPGDVYVPAGATIPVMVDAGIIGNMNDPNAENIFTFSASSNNPATSVLVPNGPTVKMTVPNYGVMTYKLFSDPGLAPNTAQHFLDLVNQGVYDNTQFYRVSRPNDQPFVIQGGPGGMGAGGQIDNEFSPYLQYTGAGFLAMANAGDDTNSSEFFVTGNATRFLDYNYSIFGYIVTGDGVRKNIQNAPVNGETPTTPISIKSITTVDDQSHAILLIHANEGATGDFTVNVLAHHVTEGDGTTQITVHIQPETTNEIPYLQPQQPSVLNVPYQTPTSFSGLLQGVNIQNVQALTRAPLTDGGTFQVQYNGKTTSALAWNVTAANLQTALRALDADLAACTVTLTGGTYTVRMHNVTGNLAVVNDLTTAGGAATSGMVAGPGIVYGYDPDNTDPGLSVIVNAYTGDVRVDPGSSAPGVKMLTVEARASDHSPTVGTDTQAVPVFVLPPAPTGLQLSAASDTGSSPSDGLTNLDNSSPAKALEFTVNDVLSGMSVVLHAKNTTTGQEYDLATTSTDGIHFTTTGATDLPDGVYEFTARQTLHVADINVGNNHDAADLDSPFSSAKAQITIESDAPHFTSTPPDLPTVVLGTTFHFTAQAETAGGDAAVYSLIASPGHPLPDNATVNPATGEVSWSPRVDQRPGQWITVRATDVYGNYSDQSLDVQILGIADRAISVVKLTNGTDNDSVPGVKLPAGSSVTWTYQVTNPGNTVLKDVAVADSLAGVTPVYQSGDTNGDGQLDLNETWIYSATGTALAGQQTSTGTATGSDATGAVTDPVTASDAENYFGVAPAIHVVTLTNGTDNNTATGVPLAVGSTITWTYQVTNSGNVPLNQVVVTDSQAGVTPVYQSGDTFEDGILSVGETWIYTATGTAAAGQQTSTGSAAGTDISGVVTAPVTASDPEYYFGGPGIQVVKLTNGTDNNTAPGVAVAAGSTVTWTYQATNPGNVPLKNVSVTDNDPGVTPVHVSGDTNDDGQLDHGETWIYTASATVNAGQHSTIATATGTDATGGTADPITGTDVEYYFVAAPAIHLVKLTNGTDNNAAPGAAVAAGSTLTWTYQVTSTGNVPLKFVGVLDSQAGVTAVRQSGDTNGNNQLDLNETWIFTATGTAQAGQQSNSATAVAKDATGVVADTVSASDAEYYFGATPAIHVVKLTNGTDNNTAPGVAVAAGGTLSWTYQVTNTGNVALKDIAVTDSQAGVTPVYQSGDVNENHLLDLDETWIYTASATALAGQQTAAGTATGTDATGAVTAPVTAGDPESYFGSAPAIHLVKLTNGNDHNTSPGAVVLAGSALTWTYQVTNTGNVALKDVAVTDSVAGVTPVYQSGDANGNNQLDLDETWAYTATGTALAGQQSNSATAAGSDAIGQVADPVTATDAEYYFGTAAAIHIVKLTNGTDNNTAPGMALPVGGTATWTYQVTNTGNVALTDVAVTDSVAGVTPVYQSGDANGNNQLDLDETWVYTATGTALAGQQSNSGTATGSDATGGTPAPVTATDPEYYRGLAGIHLVKLANGADHSAAPGPQVAVGSTVTWTYIVTNTGTVALKDVVVTDSDASVVPAPMAGDANSNGLLDVGETWVYTATSKATAGQYTGTGTATGSDSTGELTAPVTASDADYYLGVQPGIQIVTQTNGANHNTTPGAAVAAGDTVTWSYLVTNTGGAPLKNVSVTDSQSGVTPVYQSGDTNGDNQLDTNETWVYTATGTAVAGQYTNVGMVSASDATGAVATPVTASDVDHYFGAQAAIHLVAKTNGVDYNAMPGAYVAVGSTVTWTYEVTNPGNVALTNVGVTDNQAGITPVYQSGDANGNNQLDPGETWIYKATGTAVAGQHVNMATATGKDATGAVSTAVTASDSEYYTTGSPPNPTPSSGFVFSRRLFLGKPTAIDQVLSQGGGTWAGYQSSSTSRPLSPPLGKAAAQAKLTDQALAQWASWHYSVRRRLGR